MEQQAFNLSTATFVGIDAHPTEHTALAINRFEEEKGALRFENTLAGIQEFLSWLPQITPDPTRIVLGIEGGSTARYALVSSLLDSYTHVYEVNPMFTKQRRMLGTKHGKSDPADARLIAEILTKKLSLLPRLRKDELSSQRLCLRKTVWFYEDLSVQTARIKNMLYQLERECELARTQEERHVLKLIIQEKHKEQTRIKKLQKKLKGELALLLTVQGKNLISMKGIDTVLAARIVAHANGIDRFPKANKFIRYAGIAPIERSSGKKKRHIRDTRGNRQLNSTFYLAALNQLRWNPKAKAYFDKKVAEGKTKKHALRCLMRRTASIIYGLLKSGEAYRV
jgi:transposase